MSLHIKDFSWEKLGNSRLDIFYPMVIVWLSITLCHAVAGGSEKSLVGLWAPWQGFKQSNSSYECRQLWMSQPTLNGYIKNSKGPLKGSITALGKTCDQD